MLTKGKELFSPFQFLFFCISGGQRQSALDTRRRSNNCRAENINEILWIMYFVFTLYF